MALVAGLASDAELLLLDEPTSGLDPLKETVFQECIEEVRQAGRTVLLSSHILAEVEALCDRVSIIRAGKTVETGSLADLRHLTRTAIDVETVREPAGLDALPGVHDLQVDNHRARFDVDTAQLDEALAPSERPRRSHVDEHAADARGAVPAPLRGRDRVTGLGTLLRFSLRRERVRIPVYVFVLAALIASTAAQSEQLYPTAASRADYVATVEGNPGLIAMVGPPYAVTSVGGDTAWQWGAFGAVVAALMSMFIVGRHTRGEEQSGRSELVRASVVGRAAPLAAALAVAVAGAGADGRRHGARDGRGRHAGGRLDRPRRLAGRRRDPVRGRCGGGGPGQPEHRRRLRAGRRGARRLVRAACRRRRGRRDAVVAVADRLGSGDAAVRRRALVAAAAPAGLRRGAAAGSPSRCSRAATTAPGCSCRARDRLTPRPALARPVGLAFRLQRGALVGWAVGLFFGGLSIGLTAQDADSILGDSKEVDELFAQTAGSLVDNYLAVSLLSMALIGTGFALAAVLRDALRGDRRAARAAARHRFGAAALGVRLCGGRGRRHGGRAGRQRARRRDRRRG